MSDKKAAQKTRLAALKSQGPQSLLRPCGWRVGVTLTVIMSFIMHKVSIVRQAKTDDFQTRFLARAILPATSCA
jgi:hypothetical protein